MGWWWGEALFGSSSSDDDDSPSARACRLRTMMLRARARWMTATAEDRVESLFTHTHTPSLRRCKSTRRANQPGGRRVRMPDAEREPPIRLPNISMLVNLTVESLPLLGVANHTGWLQNDRFHVSNPSIIALPARARLGGAHYVVSLRLSNHNNCFRVMQRTPTPCITLLAFRLLSKFLAPLPHREAVVHWHGAWQCGRTPFEDCRLSASHGTIRLLCKTVVQRIEFELDESSVSSPRFIDHCDSPLICRNPDPSSSTIPGSATAAAAWQARLPFDFIRATPMVTVLRRGLHVRLKGERHVFAALHGSKNMNLFRGGALHKSDAAGGESHEYLERWALGPIYPPQPNASGTTGAGLPLRGQTGACMR